MRNEAKKEMLTENENDLSNTLLDNLTYPQDTNVIIADVRRYMKISSRS